MALFQSPKIIVYAIVYTITFFEAASSDIVVKDSAENGDSKSSNLLDIHLEAGFDSTSLSIKNFRRKGVKGNNLEDKATIVEDQGALNKLSTQFEILEKLLQNMQIEDKVIDVCSIERKSLGVHRNTCTLSSQNQSQQYPKNCKEVLESGNKTTGIYEIQPANAKEPFPVLCDMETKGGGWTHIQKRFDGSQDFFLEWRNYKFGFGDLHGEFWLGLEPIYLLTDSEPCELLVEIVDRDNISAYAHYSSFGIGPEKNGYTLDRLTGFSGDAGDSLSAHHGRQFSTKDLDFTKENCATAYPGGWWYTNCHSCNLNGKYINVDLPEKLKFRGVHWLTFRSHPYCHSKSRMLVRPTN